jgi:hypothetical protein
MKWSRAKEMFCRSKLVSLSLQNQMEIKKGAPEDARKNLTHRAIYATNLRPIFRTFFTSVG